jgi:Aerotolerance regulator N-terminal/von Willebrand factor type A domain
MVFFALWQFASSSMLLWAIAAIAPLVIHWLSKQRYRKVTWGAMEYLLAAVQKNQRRLQLEHWLLMAVRMLVLICFACALAEPVMSRFSSNFFASGVGPVHRIYVLDGTYSMGYEVAGKTRFDQAKELLQEQISQASQGDGFSLLVLGTPLRTMIREPVFSANDVLEELENLQLSCTSGNVTPALSEVQALARVSTESNRFQQVEIVFVGDLEKTTWEPLLQTTTQQLCAELAEVANLLWMHVGSDTTQNNSVENVVVSELPVTVQREIAIHATIAHYGDSSSSEKQKATLLINNEPVAQQPCNSLSRTQSQVSFRHRFTTPGDYSVAVKLAHDALPGDDTRYLSVSVRNHIRVLAVYGRPGETRYLKTALSPENIENSRIQVDEVNETTLLEADLNQYDALFLANISQLSVEQALLLANYVQQGGGLIILPGDMLQPESFYPAQDKVPTDFLPATFRGLSVTGDYKLNPLEYRHALVQPFRGFEKAGLLSTPIWKYAQLLPSKRDNVSIVAEFSSGDPAFVEGSFGKGKVLMFALPPSLNSIDKTVQPQVPWSAWVTWPSFPPLMHESLSFVNRSRNMSRNLLVQESIQSQISQANAGTFVKLNLPALTGSSAMREQRVALNSNGDIWSWTFGDTDQVGIYSANYSDNIAPREIFAVNLETVESNLLQVDSASISHLFQSQASSLGTEQTVAGNKATQSWFRTALLAVLLLMACESLLLVRFSGGSVT